MFLQLRGKSYTNNSAMANMGEGENALLCKTDRESCCGTPPNRAGQFYYDNPDGSLVDISGVGQGFYLDTLLKMGCIGTPVTL